jgi:cytochrome oxidase Cu insertion factor (SCO1/SenC/PrrC family)
MRLPVMLAPYLVLIAFVAGGYLWHVGDMKSGSSPYDSGEATVGGPFTLTDQNGVIRRDEEFRGKFMLVFFGFTTCPDICPTTMIVLKEALGKIGGKADRVVPIFISVDPERDTPDVLKPYLDAFSPRFVGLTGKPAEVAAAARAYRVYFQKKPQPGGSYSMDHSSIIYLMGPDGKYVTHYRLEQGPDAIAEDLAKRL